MTQPLRGSARAFRAALAALMLACAAPFATAGEADVIAVKATREAGGTFTFAVTIRSHDKGFDYYCDRFEIIAPDGGVLGVRVLEHPHADEQPFTRELIGVRIARGIARSVLVRAHHNVAGYAGATRKVGLPD